MDTGNTILTKAEVAERLRVCTKTVERYRASGRLKAIKLSSERQGRVLFRAADVDAFLASCEEQRAS